MWRGDFHSVESLCNATGADDDERRSAITLFGVTGGCSPKINIKKKGGVFADCCFPASISDGRGMAKGGAQKGGTLRYAISSRARARVPSTFVKRAEVGAGSRALIASYGIT